MDNELRKRDLSWLRFNERVLLEAKNQDVPLYERIKFLAIFSSNLDEFFSVRVSALRQFKKIRKSDRKRYNIKPNRELKGIYAEVQRQQSMFGEILHERIIPELNEIGLKLVVRENMTSQLKEKAVDLYNVFVNKNVKVELIDKEQDPPFLHNNRLYLIFRTSADGVGLVNVPVEEHGRFIRLDADASGAYYSFLEDIVIEGLLATNKYEIEEIISIKLSRDAETYIEDEFSGDLIQKIKQAIAERGDGMPTRLLYDEHVTDDFLDTLRRLFSLSRRDLIAGGRYHNFVDFFNFPRPDKHEGLFYEPMDPMKHPVLEGLPSILEHLQNQDEILHFPYQSFDAIPKLLLEAANSIRVSHIKMTLYRISQTSEVVKMLMFALKQKKKVTVFIEAKARFDEENNLSWGEELKKLGAHVIYSYPGIKIHSKIILIKMTDDSELKDVCYIGTGNFNEKTAKIYADHGLMTSHKKITAELNQVFQILTGTMIVPKVKHLMISPYTTRRTFLELVQFEIDQKKAGKVAGITIKMNSLEDEEMINKLYEASRAGVQIKMIVRGFCCLVPGVEGMSENIEVVSIVDRFLEHARIYHFHHAGDELVYIGSADWMTRNLDRRIEVCAPIYDTKIKKELLDILAIQLADNVKARVIDKLELNELVSEKGNRSVRAQYEIYEYLKSQNA